MTMSPEIEACLVDKEYPHVYCNVARVFLPTGRMLAEFKFATIPYLLDADVEHAEFWKALGAKICS